MISFSLAFLLLFFGTSLADCKFKFIHNASELIEFSKEVKNGTNYLGYTVYLVSDIDFNKELSQEFYPIGYEKHFRGIFDGQGHVISNLSINSSSQCVGLFGISYGITIKNVVIDDSCSFSSLFIGADSFVGGFLSWCYTIYGECVLENNVNMANINSTGSVSNKLYVGGIVAAISINTNKYETKIVNCINYGAIYNSGYAKVSLVIGGITSVIWPDSKSYNGYIVNCINYGSITNEGSTDGYYFIGGITGAGYSTVINNCVSTAKISSTKCSTGAIVDSAWSGYTTSISHSYWSSDTTCSSYCTSTSGVQTSLVQSVTNFNTDHVNDLNKHAADNKWSNWTFNQNNVDVNFVISGGNGFSVSSRLIVLPIAERRGYSFMFWCLGQNSFECNERYDYTKTSSFTSATTIYAQWVVNNCTVSFDVNGGREIPEDEKNRTVVYDQEIGELPVTSRRGYAFAGWFTVYGERLTNESLVNGACNCSLYAHWIPNKYTVILDVNRGNKLDNNTTAVTFNSTYGYFPIPNRSGFEFVGWYTEDNENITSDTVVNITSTQTLYAHWASINYTVKLNVSGGTELDGYDDGIEVPSDMAYELLPTPNRTGYTFVGWFTEDDGLLTNNTATTAIVTKGQTLHAKWVPNNYTVSFDVGDGDELTGYEDGIKVTFDGNYSRLPMPTRTGYTFTGWFDGEDTIITNETKVNITADCTLHANWTVNNYVISFDVNGGEELDNITVTFGCNYTHLPIPTREGYTFLWWYIRESKVKVGNETRVEIACNHTLCAAWDKNTIFFDVNGGDELGANEKEKEVSYNDVYDSLPTPTRTGYTFSGWYTTDGEEIKDGSTVTILYNQTVSAKWAPNNYTMSLDVNGGDSFGEDKKNITVTYDGTYGNLPTPSRTGYTFIGWYTEKNEHVSYGTTVTDACSCTLHANWTANTYVIVLVVNGGDELSEDERNITVTYDGTYENLPTPSREGYEFAGWFTEDGEEITRETKVNITNNQTLHAEWIKIATSSSETVAPSKYVEVVFGKGNMKEEEIRDILVKFTNAEFDIVNIDCSKSGETTVIIRFNDVEDAEMFIKTLNESSDGTRRFIRYASFNSRFDNSISVLVYPLMLFNIILV